MPPFQVPDPERKRGNLTLTYASQIHACVVEIDEETGQLEILDYAAVDDCGRRINPKIVEGQVHGATMLGVGAALYEAFEYDDEGQLQQASFYDYHAITDGCGGESVASSDSRPNFIVRIRKSRSQGPAFRNLGDHV